VTICNNLSMYIAVLTAIVEGMSGGQQASEASYALGAGGGTKQDSKDEKAFSEMLKGAGDREGVRMPPVPPHTGTWLRVLNRASGVYLYVHTETQRVVYASRHGPSTPSRELSQFSGELQAHRLHSARFCRGRAVAAEGRI
jgi:hypothetical protein